MTDNGENLKKLRQSADISRQSENIQHNNLIAEEIQIIDGCRNADNCKKEIIKFIREPKFTFTTTSGA